MSISDGLNDYITKLNRISRIEVPRGSARVLNRLAKSGAGKIAKAVAPQAKVKQPVIRRRIKLGRKATAKIQRTRINLYHRPIPVANQLSKAQIAKAIDVGTGKYHVKIGGRWRTVKGTGTNKGGVKAGGVQHNRAFVQYTRHGRPQVMRRNGGGVSLEVLKVPVKTQMITAGKSIINTLLTTQYGPELQADLKYRLSKYGQ